MKNSDIVSSSGIKTEIKSRVRGVVAIVGIGNIMRGDDGCGPKLIESLKKKNTKACLFDCGTVPENYIFPILSTSCDTIILVDAADFKAMPGGIKVLSLNEISGSGLSTHNSSIRLFTDLLMTGKDNLGIFAVSIQPKSIAFGEPLSDEVKSSIDNLADILTEALA
ncbi:MAG: hydrogenase 3 maturation endopeptidase HyCI [Candidatus Omnitrophota bacterium]|nr:hydrogenase 3 maturation endopeptidase HyCI [Candidatus Omnitrophota bacterium]